MFLTSTVKESNVQDPLFSLYEGILDFQEEFADLKFENIQLEHEFLLKQANGYLSEADEEAAKEEIKASGGGVIASLKKFFAFIGEKITQAIAFSRSVINKIIVKIKSAFGNEEVQVADTAPELSAAQKIVAMAKDHKAEIGGVVAAIGTAALAYKFMPAGNLDKMLAPFAGYFDQLEALHASYNSELNSLNEKSDGSKISELKNKMSAVGKALGALRQVENKAVAKVSKAKKKGSGKPADSSKETAAKPTEEKPAAKEDKKE